MAQKGLDYSWGRPNLSVVRKQGYTFVCRYLAQYGGGKEITAHEANQIKKAGLGLVLVYEQTANRALGGRGAGHDDANTALGQARAIGFPNDRPIYFAVDWDATPEQQGVIDEYLRGAAEVLGAKRVGVYGGYWICKRAKENKSAQWFWQTYAWSGGNKLGGMHIYQYSNGHSVGGAEVDYNEGYGKDFGAWFCDKTAPKGSEPAKPSPATNSYTIKSGDTFWGLEEAHGWSHGTLQALNPGMNPKTLPIGAVIKTPGVYKSPEVVKSNHNTTYKIQKGDTFWGLEDANGWTHGTLMQLNPMLDPKTLQIGSTIKVPSGNAPTPTSKVKAKYDTARKGDNMSLIASRNNLTLAQLEKLNPNAGHPAGNFDLIHPGDKFRVR